MSQVAKKKYLVRSWMDNSGNGYARIVCEATIRKYFVPSDFVFEWGIYFEFSTFMNENGVWRYPSLRKIKAEVRDNIGKPSDLDHALNVMSLVRRRIGEIEDPVKVVAALISSPQFAEVVYDHRIDKYVSVKNLIYPDMKRFAAIGSDHKTEVAHAFADNEEDARKAIGEHLIFNGKFDDLTSWAGNEMEIKESNVSSNHNGPNWYMTMKDLVGTLKYKVEEESLENV